jgi:NAD(P)-dependent dehydrogenase (short-subunit alcohol dehydrogenase family)
VQGAILSWLVNAAGVGATGVVGTLPEQQWRRVVDTNLIGTALGCETFLPWLRANRRRSHLVNVASIAAVLAPASMAAYSASKAGVVQAGRTLAREWARAGINVNTVSPGYIRTAINDAWFDTEPGKKQIAKFPKRRLMGEEGLDAMILFLCSDASEFVTGTDFVLDDGQTL